MGRFDALYARLPVWAQHGAVSIYGRHWHWLRFGPGYGRYVKEYTQRECLTAGEWQEWQRERLRNLLQAAVSKIPYYQRSWTIEELRNSLALREVRSVRWAGASVKMPRATFSGCLVVPDPESQGSFYRFNLAERQVSARRVERQRSIA